MQNVGSQKSIHTDEDNLDTARGPTSLSSIPDALLAASATATTQPQLRQQEGIHSDTELRPKTKTRSRFTSALRKLGGSKRKKATPLLKEVQNLAGEPVLSSGGEETPEPSAAAAVAAEKPKKKSKLTKSFILSSLKKSKVNPKKSLDEAADKSAGVKSSGELEDAKPLADTVEAIVSASNIAATSSHARGSTVQITISGRKIEPVCAPPVDSSQVAESPAETDYLTPTGEAPPTTSVVVLAAVEQVSQPSVLPLKEVAVKKKKLKVKKTPSSGSQTQRSSGLPAAAAQTTTTTTEEKFVITRSARDTPPPERAPAKPSRAAVATATQGGSGSQTLAVRQPTTRSAATLTSPSTTQRGAIKKERSSSATAARLAKGSTATGRAASCELMPNPAPGVLQRGHRFPKPPTAVSCGDSGNATPAATTAALGAAAGIVADLRSAQQQRQLQFQLLFHASQSPSLPPTPPDEEEEQQQQSQLQSNPSNALLQPPGYPPPATPFATPETRSPAHRRQPSETATLQVIAADDSVASAHSSGPDDEISSAESANPSDYLASGNNIQNPQLPGHALSQDSNSSTDAATTRFAVGSATASASVDTLHEQQDFESDSSSDSQSPLSESSRKRIRYVAQPTLFDEFNSLQRRREALKCQTAAVSEEFSLESDGNDDSTTGGEQSSMPAFGDLTMDQEMEPAIMTASGSEKREHLYKILVIGELGTGKTSFIKRYVHQFFSQNYRATIGVDFALKVLHWDKDTIVRLQLWDIAGQERFGNMTRVYYKEAVGAFIVFDVTRSGTFDCVSKWKEDLDSKVQLPDGSPIPCILLANKCDQEKQGLVTTPEKMDEYVKENGFAGWFETSAKENINIDEAARALVNKILLNDKLISAADLADSEKFNLNTSGDQTSAEPKNKCSC